MKKALLVVSFGTSYHDTLEKTIVPLEQDLAKAFPDHDFFRAFTSGMILKKLKSRDNLSIFNLAEAFAHLSQEGYTHLRIQATHVLGGDEYAKITTMVGQYASQFAEIAMGEPLLPKAEERVAEILIESLPSPQKGHATILMGHGSEHEANKVYLQLQAKFQALGRGDIHIATVESTPSFEEVMEQLEGENLTHVTLQPLMIVAGDHAKNDMAGEDSWKTELEAKGLEVTCILKGLGEYSALRQLFVDHCRQAKAPGKLYGIGVGPGDPELLTLKALRLLQEADLIVVPDKGSGEKTALNIVKEHIQGKEILYCDTPMIRDQEKLAKSYDAIAQQLRPLLAQGKTLAFITLGDPSLYSTYMYVHQRIEALGFSAQLIPAVPSFCAVAARLGISLCERDQRLLIVPASHKNVEDCLAQDANIVFMKAGREITALQETLAKHELLDKASMVENCGMEQEKVFPHFGDMDEKTGYFSLVVVKK